MGTAKTLFSGFIDATGHETLQFKAYLKKNDLKRKINPGLR